MHEEKYELTIGGRLGASKKDSREALILNRVIRWTPEGIEYEADPRQVEKLLAEVELDGSEVKGCATPSAKPLAHQIE